ncbi:hypothetical protein FGO68_gene3082 [Halteria grandinella]|uniref:Uncharacterized protein n=1 Tax=Halteria grandinella TaxID=5974 RepID=A0A8J8T236_HALGN|nr:hypothetical protein FGO68_gene3082 [Halteria grandinella]
MQLTKSHTRRITEAEIRTKQYSRIEENQKSMSKFLGLNAQKAASKSSLTNTWSMMMIARLVHSSVKGLRMKVITRETRTKPQS